MVGAGSFDIFTGRAQGQQGRGRRSPAGKTLKQTDLELEKMNYLVEGVVGSIG